MHKSISIGTFQVLALWAVHCLGNQAYGMAISDFISEREGRTVHLAQVYTALISLKGKGLIAAGEASVDRRIVYSLTPLGREVMDEAISRRSQQARGFAAEGFAS